MKKKKGKIVYVKPVLNHNVLQIDILQEKKEEKRVSPDKIFAGYIKPTKINKKTKLSKAANNKK